MSEDESSSEEQEEIEVLSDQEDQDHDEEPDPASIPVPRSSFFTPDGDNPEAVLSATEAESTDAESGAMEGDVGGDTGGGQEEGEESDDSEGSKVREPTMFHTAVLISFERVLPYLPLRPTRQLVPFGRPASSL